MKVSTPAWNRFVDRVFAHWIQSITRFPADPWRHPWYTRLAFSPLSGAYTATITHPGLCVSGSRTLDTIVTARVPLAIAPQATLDRLGLQRSRDTSPVEAYLSEQPEQSIDPRHWRTPSTVPLYFRRRGVNPPATSTTTINADFSGVTTTTGLGSNDGLPIHDRPRQLRACDLVLYHDRLSNATDWTLGAGVDGTVAQFSAIVTTKPDFQRRPYLRFTSEYQPEPDPDPIVRLTGGWSDRGVDSLHLSTLYLLSRPGMSETADPHTDPAAWEPVVNHHVFWHLGYRTSDFGSPPAPTPLQVPGLTLAGGILQSFVPTVAQINDNYAAMIQYLDARLVSGEFFSV